MSKISGKVHMIGQTTQVSEKFTKRDLVITLEGQYPQHILFQLSQDKCSLADNLKIGDFVEAAYNLRGREWTDPKGVVKFFNTLEIWSMQWGNAVKQQQASQPSEKRHPSGLSGDIATSHFDSMMDNELADDLPF